MDSGFYSACTALMARTQALESIANNLANSNTVGFKAEKNLFRTVLAGATLPEGSALNQAINDYGVLGGTQLDLSQGSLDRTGNSLDLAIQGSGFFLVQTVGGRVYTRNGNFQVSAKGDLITAQGDPVLGDMGTINISGGKPEFGPDGTISVNGAVVGKLKLVDLVPGTQLTSVGKTYYSASAKAEGPAASATVAQGFLENSNVDAVTSAVELIDAQRQAEMAGKALSFFNNDINKTATEDLPRLNS